jgi:hypothetical protein
LGDTESGRWALERELGIMVEEEFRDCHEPVMDVYVGIVYGDGDVGRDVLKGYVREAEL